MAEYSKTEDSVQQTAKNCTPPKSCTQKSSRAENKKWSQEFEKLLDGTDTQMVFDLNPNIELQIKPLDITPYSNYVVEPIIMTGNDYFHKFMRNTNNFITVLSTSTKHFDEQKRLYVLSNSKIKLF